jgi:hypothetical protein
MVYRHYRCTATSGACEAAASARAEAAAAGACGVDVSTCPPLVSRNV